MPTPAPPGAASETHDAILWDLHRGPVRPRERWAYLSNLLDRLDRRGVRGLSVGEVKQVGRLYRQVTIDLSQARTAGDDPALVQYLNALAVRAHGRVYAARRVSLRPLLAFVLTGFPRLIRRCRIPVGAAAAVFLLTALASCLAVLRDPELAYSLFDEHIVEFENVRLEKQAGGEYRGNFTFSVAESPFWAVVIIGNNVRVAILGFALGSLVCLPGLLLLTYNGRMLGTLTGLVWNGGYLLGFYSLVLTHGVLELTAICVAAGGGLRIGWALIAPGALPRRDALRAAAADGFGLLAGAVLMLLAAGVIEAYVTPHCPAPVRWAVAGASAVFLVLYFGLAGRRPAKNSPEGAAQRSPGREPWGEAPKTA
jgi:uncharacterized membrane protein SpoIIM required for sporulation